MCDIGHNGIPDNNVRCFSHRTIYGEDKWGLLSQKIETVPPFISQIVGTNVLGPCTVSKFGYPDQQYQPQTKALSTASIPWACSLALYRDLVFRIGL